MNKLMLTLGMVAFAAVAQAHEYKLGTLDVGHPWTRATPPGSDVAAGYMTITNTGSEPDVLVGASAEAAESVMIHQSRLANDMVQMDAMPDGVEIKPGSTTALTPGGIHLMWMGVKQPLKAGEWVSGTLVFKRAGILPVRFKVEAMGASEPGHAR